MRNSLAYFCPVCGDNLHEPEWGEHGQTAGYEICPCCGLDFSDEDIRHSDKQLYQEKWLANGAEWFSPAQKPADWQLTTQLKNLPEKVKH